MFLKQGILAALIIAAAPGMYETMKSASTELLAQISSHASPGSDMAENDASVDDSDGENNKENKDAAGSANENID